MDRMSSGMVGTGGASSAVIGVRCGDGERNVRSVMELWLGDLCMPLLVSWLPCDDTEALRLCVRFVCTSATLMGVVGRDRNAAAAAAAEEREELDARRANAEAAAVAAFGFAVAAVSGWNCKRVSGRQQRNVLEATSASRRSSVLPCIPWIPNEWSQTDYRQKRHHQSAAREHT